MFFVCLVGLNKFCTHFMINKMENVILMDLIYLYMREKGTMAQANDDFFVIRKLFACGPRGSNTTTKKVKS